MPSPIEPLMNAIAASPFRIAPEAADALSQEVNDLNIRLEFVNNQKKYAEYATDTRIVRLGTQYLEVLWSISYAFIVVFEFGIERFILKPFFDDFANRTERVLWNFLN